MSSASGMVSPGWCQSHGYPLEELTVERVSKINMQGGTILGTSRGAQDPEVMVDRLVELGIDILFVIGGDGSIRGAGKLAAVARSRDLPIGVIGIPKTIDNDIPFIGQSFGFQTAFTVAAQSIAAAQVEAQSRDQRGRPGAADGPACRLHRLLRGAGQPSRRFRADPRGAVRAGRRIGFPRRAGAPGRRAGQRGGGGGRRRRPGPDVGRADRHRCLRQPEARRHRPVPGGRDRRALRSPSTGS